MKKTVNRWKCCKMGLVALVVSSVVIIGCGGDSDGKTFARQKPEEKDFFDDLKEIHDATQELKRNWDKDVKEPFNKLVEEFDVNIDQKDACNIDKEFEKAAEQLQSELKKLDNEAGELLDVDW